MENLKMSLKSRRKQEERNSDKQRYHPLEIQKQIMKKVTLFVIRIQILSKSIPAKPSIK